MLSDFAEVWYAKVFECAVYENGIKILLRTFFSESDRKLKLFDFDEISHAVVFEDAGFKNRSPFLRGIVFSVSIVAFLGPLFLRVPFGSYTFWENRLFVGTMPKRK